MDCNCEFEQHFSHAVLLNNRGVCLIQEFDYGTSLALFGQALDSLSGFLAVPTPSTISKLNPFPFSRSNVETLCLQIGPAVVSHHAYLQAINLIPTHEEELLSTVKATAIILFNIAVVHHRMGLATEGVGDQKTLTKARSYYVQSLAVLYDFGVCTSCHSNGQVIIDLLTMRAYNNLAQISYFLSHYDESRRYFQQLATFAANIRQGTRDVVEAHIIYQHLQFFLYNIELLKPPTAAGAA
jgi:tetratricopeptide (TPR) repeat protein